MDHQDLILDLRTIDSSSLVDKVEMRLIEVFLYRELKPGDSIPKETELAILMGVSRTGPIRRQGKRRYLSAQKRALV